MREVVPSPRRLSIAWRSSLVEAWLTVVSPTYAMLFGKSVRRVDRPVVDLRARQLELDRLRHAAPPDREHHLGAGRPAQARHRLLGGVALGRLAVDVDDLVAGLDAGPFGRRLRQRGHDRDPAVAHVDLDAEPAVVAGGRLGERLVVVALEQDGVRVVQLLQHARRWPSGRGRPRRCSRRSTSGPARARRRTGAPAIDAAVVSTPRCSSHPPEKNEMHATAKMSPQRCFMTASKGQAARSARPSRPRRATARPVQVPSKCTMPGPETAT